MPSGTKHRHRKITHDFLQEVISTEQAIFVLPINTWVNYPDGRLIDYLTLPYNYDNVWLTYQFS